MKHIAIPEFGIPSVMTLGESAIPIPKEDEVLIRVKATSVNRADTLQRAGKYPAPQGASPILGLECAGYITDAHGKESLVMALISGGGYAQYVCAHRDHIIQVPENIRIDEAGAIPEIYLTAFLQIQLSQLIPGQTCLVYAAASGVGQATLQICKALKINTIASCSADKAAVVSAFTPYVIDRNSENQLQQIKQWAPKGVNAVFDPVGAQNYQLTIDSLAVDGTWILYGLMGGHLANISLAPYLAKRIKLIPSTLRSRDNAFKAQLINDFKSIVLPFLVNKQIQVPIFKVINVDWSPESIQEVVNLHELMEKNATAGKLVMLIE